MMRDGRIHFVRQYSEDSGIKVLDRAIAIVRAVAAGDKTLAALSADTGLPRATTHRIATALETHHILSRTPAGEWTVGTALASYATRTPPQLLSAAEPIMRDLVAETGESVQLYELSGTTRTCIATRGTAVEGDTRGAARVARDIMRADTRRGALETVRSAVRVRGALMVWTQPSHGRAEGESGGGPRPRRQRSDE